MGDFSCGWNFDLDNKNEIQHYTKNESLRMSKTAKIGCELLENEENINIYNTNIYKICELQKAIFSSFYNISQPNFAILLILRCSF
jgi:hypothetical protein